MATPWTTIIRRIGKAVGAFRSASAGAAANTDYTTSPLTTTIWEHPVITLDVARDLAIDAHGRIALEIASVMDVRGIGCHPWRNFFKDTAGPLSSPADLPILGLGGKTIIGALGQPYRNSDASQVLEKASLERVVAWSQSGAYDNTIHNFYAMGGNRVYHTGGAIIFPVCVYERNDAVTAVAANGNISIPDVLTDALTAGAIASAVAEGEFVEQSSYYAGFYKACIDAIRAGSVSMPGLKVEMAV